MTAFRCSLSRRPYTLDLNQACNSSNYQLSTIHHCLRSFVGLYQSKCFLFLFVYLSRLPLSLPLHVRCRTIQENSPGTVGNSVINIKSSRWIDGKMFTVALQVSVYDRDVPTAISLYNSLIIFKATMQ